MDTIERIDVLDDFINLLPHYLKEKDIVLGSAMIGFDKNESLHCRLIQATFKDEIFNFIKNSNSLRMYIIYKVFKSLIDKFTSEGENNYLIIKSAELQLDRFNKITYFNCEYRIYTIPLELKWE